MGGGEFFMKIPKIAQNRQKIGKISNLKPNKTTKNKPIQISLVTHDNAISRDCLYQFLEIRVRAGFTIILIFTENPENCRKSQKMAKI